MFQIITTIIAAVLIAIDQMVKNWAEEVLSGGEIAVIENVLYFKYTENTGVAFSMFSGNRWILVGITSIMLIVVLALFLSGRVTSKLELFSLSLMIAGGIGNLIDRISLGYVVDFIDVRIINFAIFNIADMCITIGAILLCLSVFLSEKSAKAEKAKKEQTFNEIDKDLEKLFSREDGNE